MIEERIVYHDTERFKKGKNGGYDVTCDKCGNKFNSIQAEFSTDCHDKYNATHYSICPKCKESIPVIYSWWEVIYEERGN